MKNMTIATAEMPNTKSLQLTRDGFSLTITLNQPEVRNAMSANMWREFGEVFDAIRNDRSIRAVVLRGAGGHFSSGGNTKERAQIGGSMADLTVTAERNMTGGAILAKIDQAPQVVIAVVQGNALGGGVGLSCTADVVIADKTANFRLPEASIGVIPAQIAFYLIRRVGMSEARRLALTAATIRGTDALTLGLVHHLCEGRVALEECLASVLADVGRCGPHAIAATKQLFREASRESSPNYISAAARLFATAYCSDEGQEGASAIKEKRRPNWQQSAR